MKAFGWKCSKCSQSSSRGKWLIQKVHKSTSFLQMFITAQEGVPAKFLLLQAMPPPPPSLLPPKQRPCLLEARTAAAVDTSVEQSHAVSILLAEGP